MDNLIRRKLGPGETDMLRASLLSGDAARQAFEAWRPRLDWENITRSWQRLIPLLERNLVKEGIDDRLIDRFGGLRRYFWLRNLKQMKLAVGIIEELRQAGIPVLALKGLSIVACYFSDRSLRPMEDVDLLVRPQHLSAATEILRRLGVDPLNLRHRAIAELEQRREFAGWPFKNAQGDYFDLHWSALHLDRRKRPDDDLWHFAREVEVDDKKILVMDPADQFIHACAHAAQDESPSAMRAVADCAAIISGGIDLQRLQRRADFHRLTPVVSDMVDVLAVDIGLPAARQIRIRTHRPLARLDLRLSGGSGAGGSSVAALMRRAAIERRGDDELFDRSLFRSLWRVLSGGRTDFGAPVKQRAFEALRRADGLRPFLASDRDRRFLDRDRLPLLGSDIIAEGLWAGLGPGWSTDEELGRWTDGIEASLCWRIPAGFRGDVQLSLRRRSVGFPAGRLTVKLWANDVMFGKFLLAESDDFPEKLRIPFEMIRDQNELVVSLAVSNPVRPCDLGLSDDRRALGLLISSARAAGAPAGPAVGAMQAAQC